MSVSMPQCAQVHINYTMAYACVFIFFGMNQWLQWRRRSNLNLHNLICNLNARNAFSKNFALCCRLWMLYFRAGGFRVCHFGEKFLVHGSVVACVWTELYISQLRTTVYRYSVMNVLGECWEVAAFFMALAHSSFILALTRWCVCLMYHLVYLHIYYLHHIIAVSVQSDG